MQYQIKVIKDGCEPWALKSHVFLHTPLWIIRKGAKNKWIESWDPWQMYRAQGYPVAVIIRLHNCTDNDLVCLQVKAIHDTVQNELCHLLALQQITTNKVVPKHHQTGGWYVPCSYSRILNIKMNCQISESLELII